MADPVNQPLAVCPSYCFRRARFCLTKVDLTRGRLTETRRGVNPRSGTRSAAAYAGRARGRARRWSVAWSESRLQEVWHFLRVHEGSRAHQIDAAVQTIAKARRALDGTLVRQWESACGRGVNGRHFANRSSKRLPAIDLWRHEAASRLVGSPGACRHARARCRTMTVASRETPSPDALAPSSRSARESIDRNARRR